MNKRNSIKIQSEAYDIVRHSLWKSAEANAKDPKRVKQIEKMLVDLDNSLFFNYQMLHDIIQGKDAEFVCNIRPDGMVMIGYQAQAVYFSLEWDDIHKLSAEIKAYEKSIESEKDNLIIKYENQLIQIKKMWEDGLIGGDDADRYLRQMNLPEHVTAEWLKHNVVTTQDLIHAAKKSVAKDWMKKHQVKAPSLTHQGVEFKQDA